MTKQHNLLNAATEMVATTRDRWNIGARLKAGLRPPVPCPPTARLAVRAHLGTGLCESEFVDVFGLDVGDLRRFESGEAEPDSAATTYLELIEVFPEYVANLLTAARIRRRVLAEPLATVAEELATIRTMQPPSNDDKEPC